MIDIDVKYAEQERQRAQRFRDALERVRDQLAVIWGDENELVLAIDKELEDSARG